MSFVVNYTLQNSGMVQPPLDQLIDQLNGAFGNSTTSAAIAVVLLPFIYPVSSVYFSMVATNPATLLGFGTWTALPADPNLVGVSIWQRTA